MCLNGSQALVNASQSLFDRWESSHAISLTVAILSMLGSAFIVVSFLVMPELRRATSRRIVVYISLADFVACAANAVGTIHRFRGNEDSNGCAAQALVTVVATLSFVAWTVSLAVYLYVSVVLDRVPTARRLMPVFHAVGWLLPLTVGVTAYCVGALGDSLTLATDGWCWVSTEPEYPSTWECKRALVLWIMLTMKAWELLSYLVVPALYIRVKIHLYRHVRPAAGEPLSRGMRAALSSVDKKLLFLPIAYVLLRVWGTVRTFNFVFHRYGDGNHIPGTSNWLGVLNYLQAFGDNGQGLLNFIVFTLLTQRVRSAIVDWFRRSFERCSGAWRTRPSEEAASRVSPNRGATSAAVRSTFTGHKASERTKLLLSQGVLNSRPELASGDEQPLIPAAASPTYGTLQN